MGGIKIKRVVFMDRDGVICKEKHLLHKKEKLELLSGSAEAIKILNDEGLISIVITNQPIVARGLATEEQVNEINSRLQKMLQKFGAKVDAFYYCPHHPKIGTNPNYTKECDCRKPKPGMILRAAKDFGIKNLKYSYLIGDTIGDILAGVRAGCKTILVETGYGGNGGFDDATPDYKVKNLYDAVVNIILKK